MILVTGGTGTLGRVLVALLREGGHEVRVLSRRTGADLLTGAGLAEALDGTDVIVHCATDGRHDVDATRNLIAAASGQHLVYVSIVGIDRIPFPYYRLKLACERLVEECGLPWTTLRATQFHDLVAGLARTVAKSPVAPVPAIPVQPVAVPEVAVRLAELAVAGPAGRVADFGGPAVRPFPDLARAYLRAAGKRRLVLPVRLPGKAFRAFRAGYHTTPGHVDGRVTFEEYLATRVPSR